MRQKKVLLLGSYGQSNLGDDLLMWNYLELLRSKGFTDIYVNANTTEFLPDVIKENYPALRIVNTYKTSLMEYITIIRSVDCVVYGGGTLYKELYSSTGRAPYSVIIRLMAFNVLAKLVGTKLYHLHIGIGSLKTALGRWISKIAIGSAVRTVFRDQKSYDFAKGTLRISDSKIAKSTDGLFINSVWRSVWKEASLAVDRKKYKTVVGVNVLSDIPDWVDRDEYVSEMKRFVEGLLKDDVYVVFVPFQNKFNPRNDLLFTKEEFGPLLAGYENQTILENVTIDTIGSYIRQCDVFIGMRFHSLLLSAVSEVPFVAVAYDTKCWRFVSEIGYDYAVELENLTVNSLQYAYENALASRKTIKKHLHDVSNKLYEEAEDGLRTLNL